MPSEEDMAWAYAKCVEEVGQKLADQIMAIVQAAPDWTEAEKQEIVAELRR